MVEGRSSKKKKWNALATNDDVAELRNSKDLAIEGVIYPNPTNGSITLNVEMAQSSEITIRIVDALGQVSLKQETKFVKGTNVLRYELHDLPNGIYSMQVIADDQLRLGEKFIIQK